jgi:hypothetical protein
LGKWLAQCYRATRGPDVAGQHTAGSALGNAIALILIVVGAVTLASISYGQFLEVARHRWSSAVHDRNAHYLLGLSLALDLQHGDVGQFLTDLDGARTWPPLHGMLVALTFLAGGVDYRLAVLPSLGSWVGTVVFGFLVARRLAPQGGNVAGLAAVIFILASPAHRVYATDTMLESLGAFLSLLALYLYVVAVQQPSRWIDRSLGLALTALFFNKYNYWMLVSAALVATEISSQPGACWRFARTTLAGVDWRGWLRAQLRQPLSYLLAGVTVLLAAVLVGGGHTLVLRGKSISVHSPHNLLHLAYIILFVRGVSWWRRGGRAWVSRLPARVQRLLAWHGLPIAVWFLLPKRLGYWLWYLLANKGENPRHDLGEAVAYYASSLANDYHLGLWSALLVAVLLAVAALTWRGLRPGSRAVLLFLLIATAVTVPHPNRKSRFLHSWIAAGWVVAGVGAANLLQSRFAFRSGRLHPWLAVSALGGLGLAHFPGLFAPGHSPERGHADYLAASTRDLTDYYLPKLAGSSHPVLLSTLEMKHLLRWSFLERYGRTDGLEVELKGLGSSAEHDRRCMARWLATTPCDTLVLIDVPPGSYFYERTSVDAAFAGRLPELLASQAVFRLAERHTFVRYGCAVALYTRSSAAPLPALTRFHPDVSAKVLPQGQRATLPDCSMAATKPRTH